MHSDGTTVQSLSPLPLFACRELEWKQHCEPPRTTGTASSEPADHTSCANFKF